MPGWRNLAGQPVMALFWVPFLEEGCMWGSRLARPSLFSLVFAGILSAQTPAKDDFAKGCAANLAAELCGLSWALAADQWIAA